MRIGVFDSGIGGMTVLKQLIQDYPQNSFFYLGDTANVPYGSKSKETIRKLCSQNAEILRNLQLDLVVIACNTASSLALDVFKDQLSPIPVVGVVEAGVVSVLDAFSHLEYQMERRVLILGTKATIQSRIYSTEIRKKLQFNEIIEQSCPLIVPIIEEGWVRHKVLKETIYEYIHSYLNDRHPGVALLACTHYPWAQPVFEEMLPGWKIVNSAKSVSQFLKNTIATNSEAQLKVEWFFTDPKAVTDMAINDFRDSLGIVIKI